MLKQDPTTTNYIFILLGSGFSFSRGCRGRDAGGMANYYNLPLYNAAATSTTLLLYALYELLVVSLLMMQDSSEDASLRKAYLLTLILMFFLSVHDIQLPPYVQGEPMLDTFHHIIHTD